MNIEITIKVENVSEIGTVIKKLKEIEIEKDCPYAVIKIEAGKNC